MGRDVWAVPGPLNSKSSAGCNRLLSEGAGVVWDVDEALSYWVGVRRPEMKTWLSYLMEGESLEQVAKRTSRTVMDILCDISELELSGKVIRMPGNRYGPGTEAE